MMDSSRDLYVLYSESSKEKQLKDAIIFFKKLYGEYKKTLLKKKTVEIIKSNGLNEDMVDSYLIKDFIVHRYNTKYNHISLTDIHLFQYIHEELADDNFNEVEDAIKNNEIIKGYLLNCYIANSDNKKVISKDNYDQIVSTLIKYNNYLDNKKNSTKDKQKIKV